MCFYSFWLILLLLLAIDFAIPKKPCQSPTQAESKPPKSTPKSIKYPQYIRALFGQSNQAC